MIQYLNIKDYNQALPDIVLYGYAPITPDANGIRWGLFDCEGWDGGADVRQALFERPFQDGALADHFALAPRVLDIHGGFIADTRDNAILAAHRLKRAFNPTSYAYADVLTRIYAHEWGSPQPFLFLDVRRAGPPVLKFSQAGRACEFSVPVVAPDPRKYGYNFNYLTVTSAAPVITATGAGDLPSSAVFVITGPVTNPRLTHDRTGWYVQFNGALSGVQSVGFTTGDHSAGGTLGRNNVDPASRWFPMLPGVNTFTLTGTGMTSATKLEAYWYDSYD